MAKVKPFIRYHGGKYYLSKLISSMMQPHDLYIEGCLGGANVLLNKTKASREIANDIDPDIIRLYSTIQIHPDEIHHMLSRVVYSEDVFNNACLEQKYDIDFAVNYIIKNRMSRGGMMKTFSKSTRFRGGQPEGKNSFDNFVKAFKDSWFLIKDVEFTNLDFMDLLNEYAEYDNSCIYLDPPYLPETRTSKKVYKCEMSYEDHVNMLEKVNDIKGQVIISGYEADIYNYHLVPSIWQKIMIDMPNNSGQGKKKNRRIEVIWIKNR
jgi:DNA adenine methylase